MLPQHPTHGPPPAKRLVLLVADGLRADTFYSVDSSGRTLAPYLRGVVEGRGKCHAPACVRLGEPATVRWFVAITSELAAVHLNSQDGRHCPHERSVFMKCYCH